MNTKPPSEIGKEPFYQDQSDKRAPTKSDTASYMEMSKEEITSLLQLGGQVHREKENLGLERHERSKALSIWDSSKSIGGMMS